MLCVLLKFNVLFFVFLSGDDSNGGRSKAFFVMAKTSRHYSGAPVYISFHLFEYISVL